MARQLLIWAGLAMLLATAGATAQDAEQVTVEKDRGLAGLWRVEVPERIAIHLFQTADFGPMRQIFCRIEDNLDIHCLNGGFSHDGTVSLDGGDVHIAWGTAMARFVIDGKRDGDAITGTFAIKFSGIAHEAPTVSLSARFRPDGASAQDSDPGLAVRLHGPEGRAALPRSTDALGALEHIEYLGHSPNLNGSGGADYFSVYGLEFAGGERICGVRGDAARQFVCI